MGMVEGLLLIYGRQTASSGSWGALAGTEADLRSLIRRARLPRPGFNPRLFAGETF